ncbi:MAG: hypothetical protein SH850_16615 [Planctomycetaceae bacterium]|nr:hypothetical protein [Planctomycetaceae bacterium]
MNPNLSHPDPGDYRVVSVIDGVELCHTDDYDEAADVVDCHVLAGGDRDAVRILPNRAECNHRKNRSRLPSLAEIAQRAAMERAGWSEGERRARAGSRWRWRVPRCRVRMARAG